MTGLIDAAQGADLPASALAVLADLRCEPGIQVALTGDRAWVRWGASLAAEVLRRVLPVEGVVLYATRGGLWYRLGDRLPTFDLPGERAEAVRLRLDRALLPLPVRPEPPGIANETPVALRLVRDDRPREASAMCCGLDELARWAENATSASLAALRATRAGDRVLLMGRPLPPLADAARFWGDRVLTPLGLRPDPNLPESALRQAVGADEGEWLVLTIEGLERVPLAAFRRLTRGAVRLCRKE